MAFVKSCDSCGNVFRNSGEQTQTGNWFWVNAVDPSLGDVRLVFGVFQYREGENREASRAGKPVDICPVCFQRLLGSLTPGLTPGILRQGLAEGQAE